jgi:hypothetical protein
MKSKLFITMLLLAFVSAFAYAEEIPGQDFSRIDELTGAKGKWNAEEGVFKISFPRTDAPVSVDTMKLDPFMGLTSWAAFQKDPKDGLMVMGDLVLFQDEVNPVLSVALENGLEVTALHNHFFFDDPKVYFMHIGGTGDAEKLASAVRKALDKVKEIRGKAPSSASTFGAANPSGQSSITPKLIEDILGVKGEAKEGMFKAVIGRKTKMPCGCEIGKTMGINTWAAFTGTDENAFVAGDFAMLESELQSVLKTLRRNNINIVAIHNHMANESPRILFLHYWGQGSTESLAKGLKAALNTQQLN